MWLFFAGLLHGAPRSDGSRYCWATDPRYFTALCRRAVAHAPTRRGPEWKKTLRGSPSAAVQQGFPPEGMARVAEGVIDNAKGS